MHRRKQRASGRVYLMVAWVAFAWLAAGMATAQETADAHERAR